MKENCPDFLFHIRWMVDMTVGRSPPAASTPKLEMIIGFIQGWVKGKKRQSMVVFIPAVCLLLYQLYTEHHVLGKWQGRAAHADHYRGVSSRVEACAEAALRGIISDSTHVCLRTGTCTFRTLN